MIGGIALPPLVMIWPWSFESGGASVRAVGSACGVESLSNVAPTASRCYYIPFRVYEPITIVKMFLLTGAASGNCDVGVFDENGVKLVSSGSTLIQDTVMQEFNVTDTVLAPGLYYLGFVADNSSCNFPIASGATVLPTYIQSSTFPLPAVATFSPAASLGGLWPVGISTRDLV